MQLKRGDLVAKVGGDYNFKGRIATVFPKFGPGGKDDGPERVVVQSADGVLMIMNPGQLHKYSDKVQEEVLRAAETPSSMSVRNNILGELSAPPGIHPSQFAAKQAEQNVLGELIALLLKTIEDEYAGRIEVDVGRKAFAVTGEEYVEITSLMDFDALQDVEGRRHSANFKLYDTPQEAIDAALINFNLYANWCTSRNSYDCGLRLYWRIKPEADQYEGKWRAYMRCLLSAKPPLDAQSLSRLLSKRSSLSTSVSFR